MKKKNFVTTVLLAFIVIMAGFAGASHAAQSAGDSALLVSGGFTHTQGADSGVLNLDAGYGYFLSERLEVGLQQTLAYSFIDGGDDQWVASTIPYVNFHFTGLSANNSFQPFVGGFIGASYNDDDVTGTLGPQLGFRSFVTESTFLLVKYRYEWFFDELTVNDIDDSKSDGNHVVTLGVGFIF